MGLIDLVKRYAPLDSHITVSSVFIATEYGKEKIRLEYNGAHCAWIRGSTDTSPWVKIDFLQSRVAVGVKIGQRCDDVNGVQYVETYHVLCGEPTVPGCTSKGCIQDHYKMNSQGLDVHPRGASRIILK